MLKANKYLTELRKNFDEIAAALDNYKNIKKEIDDIDYRYQRKDLDFKEYSRIKNNVLSGRPWTEVQESYTNYIFGLKSKIIDINSKLVDIFYNDRAFERLMLGGKSRKATKKLPGLDSLEIAEMEIPKEVKEVIEEKKQEIIDELQAPEPEPLEMMPVPKPVKLGFFKRLIYAFQAKEKPWLDQMESSNVAFGGIFSVAFLKYLLLGEEKGKDMFGETRILPTVLSLEKQSEVDKEFALSKSDILDPYLLERQIKEIKSLISKRKPEIYRANALGYIANVTVRKISIFFIEKYPDFFRDMYKHIRHSNMKILANTYINIMFFLTLISGMISIPVFTVFFTVQGGSPLLTLLKIAGTVAGTTGFTFWLTSYYPKMKASSRRRSINTNLPFAIDHMSSVIASGVSPATMFKLISSSREYGEISIEIEKISNYVEFFGYDIITAIKAVSLTTPSPDFKEFLDGFVSTIETGGDLKDYLSQKSQEALLNYRLERQKYVESLSTYSDIYTGVLIAAPLFFVTALSLVSVLGGTIAGMGVNMIITLGTYVLIPILNVLFLVFLELNQPEI